MESNFFCYNLQIGLLFFAADDDDERLGRYTRSMLVSDDDDTGTGPQQVQVPDSKKLSALGDVALHHNSLRGLQKG